MLVEVMRPRLHITGITRKGEARMKHLVTTVMGALMLHAISPCLYAAAPADDLPREVVKFADLDLTRPAGAHELYRRIQHAAREVCAVYGPGGYDHSCADQAIARAVAEVGAPLLTTHHEALADQRTLQTQQSRFDR
jgi:UrcA family protein